jgi:hypothetical protein
MSDQCKLDHSDPGTVPEFLCRACHPEFIATPEQRALQEAQEMADARHKIEIAARERAIGKAMRDIEAMTRNGEPTRQPAIGILASIRKKLERLQIEELMG